MKKILESIVKSFKNDPLDFILTLGIYEFIAYMLILGFITLFT